MGERRLPGLFYYSEFDWRVSNRFSIIGVFIELCTIPAFLLAASCFIFSLILWARNQYNVFTKPFYALLVLSGLVLFLHFHIMNFREAVIEDISQMQTVRNSVKENVLSDPGLVSYADYHKYIIHRGKGWVAEEDGTIIGFSVADLVDMNIWALFVLPRFEKKGVGKKLHQLMLDWYFSQVKVPVWLSTAPRSRAEAFTGRPDGKRLVSMARGK